MGRLRAAAEAAQISLPEAAGNIVQALNEVESPEERREKAEETGGLSSNWLQDPAGEGVEGVTVGGTEPGQFGWDAAGRAMVGGTSSEGEEGQPEPGFGPGGQPGTEPAGAGIGFGKRGLPALECRACPTRRSGVRTAAGARLIRPICQDATRARRWPVAGTRSSSTTRMSAPCG